MISAGMHSDIPSLVSTGIPLRIFPGSGMFSGIPSEIQIFLPEILIIFHMPHLGISPGTYLKMPTTFLSNILSEISSLISPEILLWFLAFFPGFL